MKQKTKINNTDDEQNKNKVTLKTLMIQKISDKFNQGNKTGRIVMGRGKNMVTWSPITLFILLWGGCVCVCGICFTYIFIYRI